MGDIALFSRVIGNTTERAALERIYAPGPRVAAIDDSGDAPVDGPMRSNEPNGVVLERSGEGTSVDHTMAHSYSQIPGRF